MAEEYVPYTGPIVTRAQALALRLPRYFTGKPCRRGHLSQRRTVNHGCTECEWKKRCREERNATERVARARNPEAYKAITDRYVTSPRGQATRRDYCLAHSKEAVQRVRAWRERNPKQALASRQAYYLANKDWIVQRVAEWSAANPEATRTRGRNYRARLNAAEGSHTGSDIKDLFVKQRGQCVYCGIKLGKDYHVDHIVALSKGGSNWPSNLQLTCGPCNNRKRATDPAEFARRLTSRKE